MEHDCNIPQLAEYITRGSQKLVRDLRRFQSVLRHCPDCQGYYCPILLEVNPRVERALQEIDEAQNQDNSWG